MREMKYQAWYNGKMYAVNMIIWYSETNIVYGLTDPKLPGSQIHVGINEAQRREYTGLHDRNGKEVYEGDIVIYGVRGLQNIGSNKLEHQLYGPVQWIQGSCCWWLVDKHMDAGSIYEVIGNIYEHPELL